VGGYSEARGDLDRESAMESSSFIERWKRLLPVPLHIHTHMHIHFHEFVHPW